MPKKHGHGFEVPVQTRKDPGGSPREYPRMIHPDRLALIVCDVWDAHWCRGANERLIRMLPAMNRLLEAARDAGAFIVHAPSDCMDFYEGSPARRRAQEALPVTPPPDTHHVAPPLPIDDSDGGCDTSSEDDSYEHRVWTRQHPDIRIDHDRDALSDDGNEVFSMFAQRECDSVCILGVHANMCILNRPFAIKQLVRWNFEVALIGDLTDSMYNPHMHPHVSHDEGTELVLAHIETYWCPTVKSHHLLEAFGTEPSKPGFL